MKQKIAFLAFALCICMSSFAQTDNMRSEILNYKDSKTEAIGKGRRMVLDKFLEGDRAKVQEIFT